jgi:hypothetical protein
VERRRTPFAIAFPKKEDAMPSRVRPLLLVLPLLALAAPARADLVLFTPPVVKTTGEGLTCVAVNVSTKARQMKAGVLEFFSPDPLDSEQDLVEPGGVVSASGDGLDGTYCRFTVDGKSKDVRASGQVRLISTGATLSVVPAH